MQKKKEEQNAKPVGAGLVPAQNKGITLIALIITIIVMLILVGVTINVALNGGLFEKADTATRQTQKEVDKEALLTAVIGAIKRDGTVDFEILDENLPTKEWSGEDGTYTSPKGNTYTVDENGAIEEMNTIADNKKYYNYTVDDLSEASLGTLLGEYSGNIDELMIITKEEYAQFLMIRRTSENFIGFHICNDFESVPTLGYYYDFINNKWYDMYEEELNEVPTITFSNARRLSAEEIEELVGMIEEENYIGFTQEQLNAIFTITSVE